MISFLTIIPAGGSFEDASMHFYMVPIVGFIEGALSSIPVIVVKPITAALATALTYIINGFQHMDGFIDFSETLATGRRGYDAVKVLKDTHRGSFAITIGIIDILVVYSALVTMGGVTLVILPLTGAASAYSMFITANLGRQADSGMGRYFIVRSKGRLKLVYSTIIYVVIALAVALTMLHNDAEAIMVITVSLIGALSSSLISIHLSHSRLGFVNGDVLGFSFELSKAIILTTLSLALTTITWLP